MKNLFLLVGICFLLLGCSQTSSDLSLEKTTSDELSTDTYNNAEESEKEAPKLLSLDPGSFACTDDPIEIISDIGGVRTVYPVADEYEISADDYHNLAGLFTASACGKERLNELFSSKEFKDVVIFTNSPNSDLVAYLKANNFVCSDKAVSENNCSRWYNSDSLALEVLDGLREWAKMIHGSDCENCG